MAHENAIYMFPETGDAVRAPVSTRLAFFHHERDSEAPLALLPSQENAAVQTEGPLPPRRAWTEPVGIQRVMAAAPLVPPPPAALTVSATRVFPFHAWRHVVVHKPPRGAVQHYWLCGAVCPAAVGPLLLHQQLPTAVSLALASTGGAPTTLGHVDRALLDCRPYGAGRYTLYLGAHYALTLDVTPELATRAVQLQYSMAPHGVSYVRGALPDVRPATAQQLRVGVSITVYRSNYRTVLDKATREVELAEAAAEKVRDDLDKADVELEAWRTLVLRASEQEKRAQETATVMTPDGLLGDPEDASAPVRERLDERLVSADEDEVDAKTKLKTSSRTLKRLKLNARKYAAARTRQRILNRARGIRGIKVPKLKTKTGDLVAKRFQATRKTYKALKKRRGAIKKTLVRVTKERDDMLAEAEALAEARAEKAVALRDKRDRADEAQLDFILRRQGLQEETLEELRRTRKAGEDRSEATGDQTEALERASAAARERAKQERAAEKSAMSALQAERRALEEEVAELRRQREAIRLAPAPEGAPGAGTVPGAPPAPITALRAIRGEIGRLGQEERVLRLKHAEKARMQLLRGQGTGGGREEGGDLPLAASILHIKGHTT